MNRRLSAAVALLILLVLTLGCRRGEMATGGDGPSAAAAPPLTESSPAEVITPQSYEAGADQLLAMRLPAEQASDGWIRLFDGYTLFGWEITGAANWRVQQGSIIVDAGQPCLLCTSMPWQDYELTLEFKAGTTTNSGVFLRTPLEPEDPALDCYEVNIAPDDHPFPTGSVVKRKKADDPPSPQVFDQWRTMKMRLEGDHLQVSVDQQLVCDYTDPIGLTVGRIGLQHNQGRVEFRNILLRPLGLQSLLDADLSKWKKYPDMPGDFTITEEGWMHVQGGRTQLESTDSYGDFVLLAEYKLPTAEMNSGIFFRCIPGDEMMGYECQLSNAMTDGNRLAPADHGTGGIFRRQPARVVAGEVDQWSSVLLVAHDRKMAAWVGGVQVSDWYDDRQPHENPRKGSRLQAGTLMIQGHDPETDALLKQIAIASIEPPPADASTP